MVEQGHVDPSEWSGVVDPLLGGGRAVLDREDGPERYGAGAKHVPGLALDELVDDESWTFEARAASPHRIQAG